MKYFDTITVDDKRLQSLFQSIWESLDSIKPAYTFTNTFANGDVSERRVIYAQWLGDSWLTFERESIKKPIAYLPGEFKTTSTWGIRTTSRINAYSMNETIAVHPSEKVKAYNIIPFKKLKDIINSLLSEKYSIEEVIYLFSKPHQKTEV